MSKHSVSKAMGLSNVKPVQELRIQRDCPHGFCNVSFVGTKGEMRTHYREFHKCSDCNHDRHDKCKGDLGLCGCICREQGGKGNGKKVVLLKTMKLAFEVKKAQAKT